MVATHGIEPSALIRAAIRARVIGVKDGCEDTILARVDHERSAS
jgi:hypothetical protein